MDARKPMLVKEDPGMSTTLKQNVVNFIPWNVNLTGCIGSYILAASGTASNDFFFKFTSSCQCIRGRKPFSVARHFRDICALRVNFMHLYFLYELDFWWDWFHEQIVWWIDLGKIKILGHVTTFGSIFAKTTITTVRARISLQL